MTRHTEPIGEDEFAPDQAHIEGLIRSTRRTIAVVEEELVQLSFDSERERDEDTRLTLEAQKLATLFDLLDLHREWLSHVCYTNNEPMRKMALRALRGVAKMIDDLSREGQPKLGPRRKS